MKPRRRRPTQEVVKQGPRARDADREQVVEELQAAYVDGQIDADERERRTDLALRGTHLEDLRPLVADLQVSPRPATLPEDVPPSAAPQQKATRTKPRRTSRANTTTRGTPLWVKFLMGAAAVVAIGGTGFGIAASVGAFSESDADRYAAAQAERAHQPTVQWSEVRDELPDRAGDDSPVALRGLTRWSITRSNLEALLDGYRKELGTPYFRRIQLNPGFAVIDRPVAGKVPTLETWVYDERGRFSAEEIDSSDGDMTLMNIADLDIDRLFANIDKTLEEAHLDDDGTVYSVTVELKNDQPEVSIMVADPDNITAGGYFNTTLSGKIYRGAFSR